MRTTLFCLFILFSYSTLANDLEIFSVSFLCKKQEEGSFNKYLYHVGFYLKNVSNKELSVVSKIGGKKLVKRANENHELVLGLNPVIDINGTPLIPSAVKFELVKLQPGEATDIGYKFGSRKLLSNISLTYGISDLYGGRFGFWSGQVTLSKVTLNKRGDCK
ncbi:MAG: hypothetical protein COA75_08440 [Cellvibrionales bacterium]|nr:MAG: hypothetical protein COA75_08440 [Cellvibrionales bacterium]